MKTNTEKAAFINDLACIMQKHNVVLQTTGDNASIEFVFNELPQDIVDSNRCHMTHGEVHDIAEKVRGAPTNGR